QADNKTFEDFNARIAEADVAYLGEAHYENGHGVAVADFIRETLAPLCLVNGYQTFLLEMLPSVTSLLSNENYCRDAKLGSPDGQKKCREFELHLLGLQGGLKNL